VNRGVPEFGRLAVLAGNAGISEIGPVADLDVDGRSGGAEHVPRHGQGMVRGPVALARRASRAADLPVPVRP